MAPPQRELVALDHHKLAMHPIGHINPAVHPDHALRSAQMARGGGPELGRGHATSAAAKSPATTTARKALLRSAGEYARSAHQFGSCRLLFALCV